MGAELRWERQPTIGYHWLVRDGSNWMSVAFVFLDAQNRKTYKSWDMAGPLLVDDIKGWWFHVEPPPLSAIPKGGNNERGEK